MNWYSVVNQLHMVGINQFGHDVIIASLYTAWFIWLIFGLGFLCVDQWGS